MNTLKRTDDEILAAMNAILATGYIPPMRSIARKTGLASTDTVSGYLRRLTAKKLVRRLKTFGGTSVYLPTDFIR